jgi:HKD family nuclease
MLSAIQGLGEYQLPFGKTFFNQHQLAKIQKVASAIIINLAALASLLLPFPFNVGSSCFFGFFGLREIFAVVGTFKQAPPTQQLISQQAIENLPALGELSTKPLTGYPTKDATESHKAKLDLISRARQSIVLSGCYCGGKSFNEALDLIGEQMVKFPALKVSILSSTVFLTQENKKRIAFLHETYPDNFQCIETPEAFTYLSPHKRITATTNHAKALVIDYGTEFLIGGSGMVSLWADEIGEIPPEPEDDKELYSLFLGLIRLSGFRDMDFVFSSPETGGVGTRLYVEVMKLFERYRYTKHKIQRPIDCNWGHSAPLSINTNLQAALYCSGPEQTTYPFHDEIVTQINAAQNSIVINHTYFRPTPAILQALIDASNRNVQITIISNKYDSGSPATHLFFAELSRYFAQSIFEGRPKPNIEILEFDVAGISLHKKGIVFDGKTVLTGSSNINTKSLENHDYEVNLKINSEEFATEVMKVFEADKKLCKPLATPWKITLSTRIISTIQSLFHTLIWERSN